jgi:hypothetical protein
MQFSDHLAKPSSAGHDHRQAWTSAIAYSKRKNSGKDTVAGASNQQCGVTWAAALRSQLIRALSTEGAFNLLMLHALIAVSGCL